MGLFDKFLGKKKNVEQASPVPEHAVLVHIAYGSTDLSRLFALEKRLEKAIVAAGVGEFDGNEVATDGSDGTLYMYGPDADALFAAVRPALEATDFMRGARVQLRYGPSADGVREVEVELGTKQATAIDGLRPELSGRPLVRMCWYILYSYRI